MKQDVVLHELLYFVITFFAVHWGLLGASSLFVDPFDVNEDFVRGLRKVGAPISSLRVFLNQRVVALSKIVRG